MEDARRLSTNGSSRYAHKLDVPDLPAGRTISVSGLLCREESIVDVYRVLHGMGLTIFQPRCESYAKVNREGAQILRCGGNSFLRGYSVGSASIQSDNGVREAPMAHDTSETFP